MKSLRKRLSLQRCHKHVYLTGMTGSGKSSLVEQRIYTHWLASQKDQDVCIIFIDPHGDSVEKLKRSKLASKYFDRMIYIDPILNKSYTPCINPLQLDGVDRSNVEMYAESLVNVFAELIPDAKLSNYMNALLMPCITNLLLHKHASLPDLQSMMNTKDEQDNPFVQLGKMSSIPAHKTFFNQQFDQRLYHQTKLSIYTKLQSLLNSSIFYNCTTGQSTIHLQSCIRKGQIILINLSKGRIGEQVSATLGRFIIAKIKGIAFQRARNTPQNRKPIYLVIDEADTFLGKNQSLNVILKETRKYGLHLFLITQNLISGKLQAELKRNVLSNTYVKIIGMNGLSTLHPLSKEINVHLKKLQELNAFEFIMSIGKKRPFKIRLKNAFSLRGPLVLNRTKVKSINHQIIKKTSYYKPILPNKPAPEEWIDEYPFDQRTDQLDKAMPKPLYPELETGA